MKMILIASLYSVWEYWLGKTVKFAANSTIELVVHLLKGKIKWKKISS